MSYGAQVKFGVARQSAGGTAVSAPTSYHGFAFVSHDVGLEKDELISQNLIGRFEQGAVYSGVGRVNGTIEFEVTPRNIGAALAMVVNWSPGVVTSGSLKTYTFLPNTQDFDGTYVKAPWTGYSQFTDSNSAEQFYDLQAGQLELTVAQGQFLRGKMTVNGGKRTATGVGSAAIQPDPADVGVLYPWNVSSISIAGTAIGEMSEVTVTLNENLDALYTDNASLDPFKFTRTGFREVTVAGTLYLVNRNLFNNFTSDTLSRLLITIVNTRTAVQSGYFNTLTIDVPQMKFTQFKLPVSGVGEVQVPFQARGVIDPSSSYSVQFILANTYAAGY